MKKVFLLIFAFIILLSSFNFSVFALSNTYDLDELGFQVTFPSDYSVITRDTLSSDMVFDDFGTTKSEVMSHFESNHIYLDAVSDTYNEEIVVTMMKNDIDNLSYFSDTVLNTFATTLINEHKNYGINVLKYEIYNHTQSKFIVIYFTDTANTVHGLQYYTIYDGKAMNFTMRSYEGSLSSRQETTIKTIVDSIKYDTPPLVPEEGEDTDSFIHNDTDSGVVFTVPANWKQEKLIKDRDYIDVKFASTKDDGCIIIYGSTDVWDEMSDLEKAGLTRSDLNNSAFEKSDIAEMYEIPEENVTIVAYNGTEYFKIESDYTSDEYGIDITVTMNQLIYVENGWMYLFQFFGASTHELYHDFENLLKSVQYPFVTDVSSVITSVDMVTETDSDSSTIIFVVLMGILTIIMVSVIVFLNNNTIPKSETIYKSVIPCRKCGQELPSDSEFCHKCGTRIEKEI